MSLTWKIRGGENLIRRGVERVDRLVGEDDGSVLWVE